MTTISIFSYFILFSIFLLNSFKKLSAKITLNIFWVILLLSFGILSYFSNIHSHYLFPIILMLVFSSYYTILVNKTKVVESANLFITAGQILLPIFLVIENNSVWEVVVVVSLLEGVRLISNSYVTTKKTTQNLLLYINSNYKLFLLIISSVLLFLVSGQYLVSPALRVNSPLIIVPMIGLLLSGFWYMGGINSVSVERLYIKNYKSKNYLDHVYIYQFLISFVIFQLIKKLQTLISFEIYEDFIVISFLCFIFIGMKILKNYFSERSVIFRLHLFRNLILIPIVLIYLNSSKFTEYNFILIGSYVSTMFVALTLLFNYKVRFKRVLIILLCLMCFAFPISPLFFIILDSLEMVDVVFKEFFMGVIFTYIIILNVVGEQIVTEAKQFYHVKKYNKFVNYRVLYLIIGAAVCYAAIIYDKV